jgi:hypothetical protein
VLSFPYLDEPLTGPPPPSLPAGAAVRWRPLVPVDILGPSGLVRHFGRAVLDPGADDTVFPLDTGRRLGVRLRPDTGHRIRWRGQLHPLLFGDVELVLADDSSECRWPAVVAFSPAPLRYPILGIFGICGCLVFFDGRFLGADWVAELDPNRSYPGTST